MKRIIQPLHIIVLVVILLAAVFLFPWRVVADDSENPKPKVAAIVTEYRHNSHADVIVSRILQSYTLDGKGAYPKLELASLYTDQVPENDTSRTLSAEHDVPIFDTVRGALTLGGDELAVDGILLIAEHGKYPESETGQIIFPKRRLFEQIVKVFDDTGKVVPVFCDKHLADNWEDAAWIYEAARRRSIPMMAGSSLPVLWRYPSADVKSDRPLQEIVAISYHRLDAYGFHALEMVQCLAEQRRGGETGIRRVRCVEGDAVWQAGRDGVYDPQLLEQCLKRLKERPLPPGKTLEELVKAPILFVIDYEDGLRASVLTLDGAVVEWSAAWKYADGPQASTLFWTQEARPFMHFSYLLQGVEWMMHRGKPAWPVERTLLTSGVLDALLKSRRDEGKWRATPELGISYQSRWKWQAPPPPPPGRPIQGR